MSAGRALRIAILLVILAFVALDAWLTRARTTSWEKTLRVSVYPIAGDPQPATQAYLASLTRDDFATLESFVHREARRYGIALDQPVRVTLGPVLSELPPLLPERRNVLDTVGWSLRLRWWAWGIERNQPRPRSQVRVFVLYYDPDTQPRLAHSLGLKEGLIGVVHAFASRPMTPTNNIVIAHELLHTLGATDKYDAATGQPLYPHGYAEPDRQPRHPQEAAEVMAGRVALAPDRAEIPVGLDDVVVGPATAREIGWSRP